MKRRRPPVTLSTSNRARARVHVESRPRETVAPWDKLVEMGGTGESLSLSGGDFGFSAAAEAQRTPELR
jgi:hypothetical protein